MAIKRKWYPIVIVVLLLVLLPVAYFCWPSKQNDPVRESEPPAYSDVLARKLVVGEWQDAYKGKRMLTINQDGTAQMIVEPDGLGALYAPRLVFQEEWVVENGYLTLNAIGGKPKAQVNFILKTMGTQSTHKILELTENKMLLLDGNGETTYSWQRVK